MTAEGDPVWLDALWNGGRSDRNRLFDKRFVEKKAYWVSKNIRRTEDRNIKYDLYFNCCDKDGNRSETPVVEIERDGSVRWKRNEYKIKWASDGTDAIFFENISLVVFGDILYFQWMQRTSKVLAIASATHPRLGQESKIRELKPDVLRMIARMALSDS